MVDREVQNAIKNQVPRVGKSALKKEINTKFKKIKKEMIQEFLSLPVTQELLGGPDAPNISGTLNGFTSLFAFIGFDSGDQPIAPILNALERTQLQYLKELKQTNKVGGVFTVTLPTAEQIFSITPMPWAIGRSWAQGIETGISGLGFLLRKKGKGRSGVALQSRVKVRGGRFRNTAYISSFIKKYERRFQNLK